MEKIGIISSSCPKSVATVVLSYIKALKLWRFQNVVDFWLYFHSACAKRQLSRFRLQFGQRRGIQRSWFPVRVEHFDDQKAIGAVVGHFLLRMRRNAIISTSGPRSLSVNRSGRHRFPIKVAYGNFDISEHPAATLPLDSPTPISYKLDEDISAVGVHFQSFCILSPIMRRVSTSGLLDLIS